MMRFVPVVVSLVLVLFPVSVSAYRDQAVLGVTTQLSSVEFPPVTSGPGFILPDSPLYFLDNLYQQFRLGLVFTSENKAQLHMAIAGERLAEMRVEASRNNQVALDTALIQFQHEAMAAAQNVRDAAAQGKDVTQLARDIHQTLTDYKVILAGVAAQVPDTSFEQKLATATNVIKDARVISEDALPNEDIEHEIAAAIDQELDEAVLGVTNSTGKLERTLTIYEKYASRAAEAKAKREQAEASRSALQDKRKELIAQRQKAIQDYLAKADALRKQREKELAQLKATIKDLQAQLKQLREGKISPSLTPTATPTP